MVHTPNPPLASLASVSPVGAGAGEPLSAGRVLSLLELAHPGPLPALLERHAHLTLAALGRSADATIEGYQQRVRSDRSVAGFLEQLIARTDDPVVFSLARFERALLLAREAQGPDAKQSVFRWSQETRLRLHPAARMVELPGPADQVIGAVSLGLPLPVSASLPVLVSPGLSTLWRQASAVEDAMCTWLTRPRSARALLERFSGADRVLPRLLAARAIVPA